MNLSRKTVIIIAACFLACSFSACSQKSEEFHKQPNVVFIIVDDLNDYEGVFGGHPQAKTPNINKLAESGVTFTNAHSNCPVCSPSRNSLFTGVYPHESGDFGWIQHFKQTTLKNNKTLVEYFKENGYYTLGSGKLLHVEQKINGTNGELISIIMAHLHLMEQNLLVILRFQNLTEVLDPLMVLLHHFPMCPLFPTVFQRGTKQVGYTRVGKKTF